LALPFSCIPAATQLPTVFCSLPVRSPSHLRAMENISRISNCSTQGEAIKLVLRSTFIDVETPWQAEARSRSSSMPARTGGQMVSAENEDEHIYVSNLVERACRLESAAACAPTKQKLEETLKLENKPRRVGMRRRGGTISRDLFSSDHSTVASVSDLTEATSMSEGDTSITPTDLDGKAGLAEALDEADGSVCATSTDFHSDSLSLGSFGHPFLCERACAYAAAGLCTSGSECRYCHIPHTTKQVHLDKRNRQMLQAMPYEARAAMMLPILEQKAHENDFGPACESLLTLLANEANLARGHQPVPSKLLAKSGLSRVMTAMSFHTVLRHLLSNLPIEAAPSTSDVHIFIEAMRAHVDNNGCEGRW